MGGVVLGVLDMAEDVVKECVRDGKVGKVAEAVERVSRGVGFIYCVQIAIVLID